jgi:hypothetical protein
MHVCNDRRIVNKLDVSCFESAFHDLIADHLHTHLILLPQAVHNLKEL